MNFYWGNYPWTPIYPFSFLLIIYMLQYPNWLPIYSCPQKSHSLVFICIILCGFSSPSCNSDLAGIMIIVTTWFYHWCLVLWGPSHPNKPNCVTASPATSLGFRKEPTTTELSEIKAPLTSFWWPWWMVWWFFWSHVIYIFYHTVSCTS